jgi:pimeloyl-ACP methyl ester carboxylesterase
MMDRGGRESQEGEERVMGGGSGEVAAAESDGDGVRRRRSGGESAAVAEETRSDDGPLRRVVVQNENPFFFWLWFMCIMSTIMLFFVAGTSILNRSDKIEILSMPPGVRAHFEAGKLVKVEVGRDRSPVKVFVRSSGEAESETALLLHGLGSSSFLYRNLISLLAARELCAVAVDLPGAGLAEKLYLVNTPRDERQEENRQLGFLQVRLEALKELLVQGFSFSEADESSEHEFLAKLKSSSKRSKGKKALALGPDELAAALDQIVASLELAPVHLVLHDTGVEVGLAWASQNPTKVASITLIDSLPRLPSLPFWLFRIPLLGPLIAHSDLAFRYAIVWIFTFSYDIGGERNSLMLVY